MAFLKVLKKQYKVIIAGRKWKRWRFADTVRSIAEVRIVMHRGGVRNTGVIKHILGTKHREHGKKHNE